MDTLSEASLEDEDGVGEEGAARFFRPVFALAVLAREEDDEELVDAPARVLRPADESGSPFITSARRGPSSGLSAGSNNFGRRV